MKALACKFIHCRINATIYKKLHFDGHFFSAISDCLLFVRNLMEMNFFLRIGHVVTFTVAEISELIKR